MIIVSVQFHERSRVSQNLWNIQLDYEVDPLMVYLRGKERMSKLF